MWVSLGSPLVSSTSSKLWQNEYTIPSSLPHIERLCRSLPIAVVPAALHPHASHSFSWSDKEEKKTMQSLSANT